MMPRPIAPDCILAAVPLSPASTPAILHRPGLATLLAGLLLLTLAGCAGAPSGQRAQQADAERALRLGQQLFRQDRMAWVASDVYQAELEQSGVPPPASVTWAISRLDDGASRVSFLIDIERDGGYVDGEVYFEADADADACLRLGEQEPERCAGIGVARGVRAPTAQEQLWLRARRSMYADPALRVCTEAAPNYSLLWDQGRLYGYILSASKDIADVILAGHTRFELDAEGARVLERRPLFQHCRVARIEPGAERPDAFFVAGDGAALFHEGHVFLLLDQRLPVHVLHANGRHVLLELVDGQPAWRRLR